MGTCGSFKYGGNPGDPNYVYWCQQLLQNFRLEEDYLPKWGSRQDAQGSWVVEQIHPTAWDNGGDVVTTFEERLLQDVWPVRSALSLCATPVVREWENSLDVRLCPVEEAEVPLAICTLHFTISKYD